EAHPREGQSVIGRDSLLEKRLSLSEPGHALLHRGARRVVEAGSHAGLLGGRAAPPDRRGLVERASRREPQLGAARKPLQTLARPTLGLRQASVPLAAVRQRDEEPAGEALRFFVPREQARIAGGDRGLRPGTAARLLRPRRLRPL